MREVNSATAMTWLDESCQFVMIIKGYVSPRLYLLSFPRVETRLQYPLAKRICKRLSQVVAFINRSLSIDEYESLGRLCHCAAALRSVIRSTQWPEFSTVDYLQSTDYVKSVDYSKR